MRFPGRVLRGVRARYVLQAGCPSYLGIATLDFEPLPGGRLGYDFVNALSEKWRTGPYADEVVEYSDALDRGIRLRLAGARFSDLTPFAGTSPPASFTESLDSGVRLGGAEDASVVAVRVVLRTIEIHDVDSSEVAFRRAGWLGAQQAIELDGR
jgi:translation elongation factor EF-G